MVRHIVLWKLKNELTNEEGERVKKEIKDSLEALKNRMKGVIEIKVQTEGLSGSTVDVLLDSSFENEEALKNYATHPEHIAVAENKVKPFVSERICYDYEIN